MEIEAGFRVVFLAEIAQFFMNPNCTVLLCCAVRLILCLNTLPNYQLLNGEVVILNYD